MKARRHRWLTCFNLVIEVLLISRYAEDSANASLKSICFNLVIEVLLISSHRLCLLMDRGSERFNLVIEVLLISRGLGRLAQRESLSRFNLVIEVLLISTMSISPSSSGGMFQSRNRGSFDFNASWLFVKPASIRRFNLVIEVLLISSDGSHSWKSTLRRP